MLSDWSHVNITKWKLNAEHTRKFVTLEKKNAVNHLHSFWFVFIRKNRKTTHTYFYDLDIETKNGMVINVSDCNISTDAYTSEKQKLFAWLKWLLLFFPNIIWSFRLIKSYFYQNEFITVVYRFYEKDSDWDVICWENLSRSTIKPWVQFI